jgi:hypothetical protein
MCVSQQQQQQRRQAIVLPCTSQKPEAMGDDASAGFFFQRCRS